MPIRIPDTLKDISIGQACIYGDRSNSLQVRFKTTRPGALLILTTPILSDDFPLFDDAFLQSSTARGEQFGPKSRDRISILQPHSKLKGHNRRTRFQIPNVASP